jgi:hypothetical protein
MYNNDHGQLFLVHSYNGIMDRKEEGYMLEGPVNDGFESEKNVATFPIFMTLL